MDARSDSRIPRLARVVLGILLIGASPAWPHAQAGRQTTGTATSPDGIPIAYEVHGDGAPALVFVHGWSCDRGYWAGQLEPFSRRYTVVAMDLAGHGASGGGRHAQSMRAFGADVAAVVDELRLKRVVLIGHSMGGDVIIEAARQLSGRAAGLIWVDAYHDLDRFSTPEEIREMAAKLRAGFADGVRDLVRQMFPASADKGLVERVARQMSSAPPESAIPALEAAFTFAHEVPAALKALNLPVVAINGEHIPTNVASLEKHGIRVSVMPGVGHFLMMEDPERFNRLLEKALDTLVR